MAGRIYLATKDQLDALRAGTVHLEDTTTFGLSLVGLDDSEAVRRLLGIARTVNVGSLGSSYTLDLAGDVDVRLVGTLTADLNLSITNWSTIANSKVELLLTQDATGGHNLSVNNVDVLIPDMSGAPFTAIATSMDAGDTVEVVVTNLLRSRRNPNDGSRSIEHYGGGPDKTASQNETAFNDLINDIVNIDVIGCAQMGPGRHLVLPMSFEPKPGVMLRGFDGLTILQSSDPTVHEIINTTQDGWSSFGIIYDGARDQYPEVDTGPSVLVVNDAHDIVIQGGLRNPFNNGIVARGPGITNCRFDFQRCFGSGANISHGGGHMVACTGDGFFRPFDVVSCIVKFDGWDILNGGVNVGSCHQVRTEVIIWNDYDEAVGPSASGAAGLRLANGSDSVSGFAIVHGAGRGVRIGPCEDISLFYWAKHCAYEGLLLSGGPYTDEGWKGGDARIVGKQINCNMIAGNDGARSKSHQGTAVKIDSINQAGSTALPSTLVIAPPTDDGDLGETRTAQGVNIYWDNRKRYRWKIVDHPGDATRIDVTVVREVEGTDFTVDTFTCGQNNDAFVTALMASKWPADATNGRAYVMNGAGNAMQRSTNGRSGPMDHRLRVADIAAYLLAPLNAGEATSTLSLDGDQSQDSPTSVFFDPSGASYLPFFGILRDSPTSRQEVIRFDKHEYRLSITGNPSGGIVTLEIDGDSVDIPKGSTLAAFQALIAATRAGADGVTASGGPLPGTPVTFSFTRSFVSVRRKSVALTGGVSPGAQLGGGNFTVQRAQRGTTAIAWSPTDSAIVYCHPSDIVDEGGRSDHMGDAFNGEAAIYCRVDTDAIQTDEPTARGVGPTGTLLIPRGLREVHLIGANKTINTITGRGIGRRVTIFADSDGYVLQHGVFNVLLAGQRDLNLDTGQNVEMLCDANGNNFYEVGYSERPARILALGNISGTVNVNILPGDRSMFITATLIGDAILNFIGITAGRPFAAIASITQGGAGGYGLTSIPTARRANHGANLPLSTAVGLTDDIGIYSRTGSGVSMVIIEKDMV